MEREHSSGDHRRGDDRTQQPQESPADVQADERAHALPRDACRGPVGALQIAGEQTGDLGEFGERLGEDLG